VKAFLFLEGETKGKADPVEATELADLLTGKGIPVCILNACQSGKQVSLTLTPSLVKGGTGGDLPQSEELRSPPAPLEKGGEYQQEDNSRETSLGSRLMAAGMQMVVAMGYSVTVTAASLLMEKVYRELFDNKGITEAIRLGRRELFNRKSRQAYFNQTIDLEDWLLPVVYCNQSVNLNLREFSPEEEENFFEFLGSQYRFTQPQYGFVGRDLEILKVEKALLRHNILLLQGMGGTGKTTLLTYLREWWQITNFAEDVFYFGYDQKAWTLAQILFEIGKRVYDRFELSRFQAMNQAAQVQKLVAKLKSEGYILILDNLESVTGQRLAIQNTLSKKKQTELRDFLAQLVAGKTRVVLGSRSGEEWLKDQTFKSNIYQLQGLDPQSRSVLAEKILERHVVAHRIPTIREDAEFARLMKLLAGYPLAMEVVLANLKQQSPKEILEKLQAADVNLDNKRESGDKTESILKCVEYSHSNLSPEAQELLLCLAPFSGFIDRSDIPNYAKELQKLEPFKDYAFDKFDAAIQEAINWGLLSPLDEDTPQLLRIQPVFPYFLKTKLDTLDESTCEALREGFKNHYQGLAGSYRWLMESKEAQERQLGIFFCDLEYENLYNALQICLEKQESIDIFFCLDEFFTLNSNPQSGLRLEEFVCQKLANYPAKFRETELGEQIAITFGLMANNYLRTKQYPQAREAYKQAIAELQLLSSREAKQTQLKIATTYHNLGIVAEQLREYEQARAYYQQALDIYIEFGDRFSCASTYHQLGRFAQQLREYKQARAYYQQALDIFIEFGARYSCAATYHQLGRVAEELREYEQARAYYQQALDIYIEFGDRFSQAGTYHQLGRVAEELREYEQARAYYQQALDIKLQFGDRFSQASTYHQLGRVAEELREWEQARAYYQQALDIFIEFGDHYSQVRTYRQLGLLAEAQEDYA
jgi:tetratricopeptide (TPR) repeat protein